MDQRQPDAFHQLERSGYLNAIRETAMSFTTPLYGREVTK